MKKLIIILTGTLIVSTLFSQSIERDVVASSGDYFEAGGISISGTLGEIAIETYESGNLILTQGFQQPGETGSGVILDLMAFFEGPFNGSDMNTTLNPAELPLDQPYNVAPWNYPGTEAVASMPNGQVVDWILVELRDAPDVASATSATIIATQAAFLLKDGSVVGTDGSSSLTFDVSIANSLFVVLWHRNHLGIISAYPVMETGGIYTYDFSSSADQVFGGANAHKQLDSGIWGMVAADGDADGQINNADKNNVWTLQAGSAGYLTGDFNLDAQVNNNDKNDLWVPNSGSGGQVPDGAVNGFECRVPK